MISRSLLVKRLSERGADYADVLTPEAPDSTNNLAKVLAASDPKDPVLIAADFQSGGRGRQGKTFVSPPGGLYLSALLPAGLPPAAVVGVTSASAVAVARAVEETAGVRTEIKWVNDILAGGGKLAGILCEAVGGSSLCTHLVVGVGVNLTSAPRVEGAALPPVSLRDLGREAEPEALAAAIAAGLLSIREQSFSFAPFLDEYRARSAVLGRPVSFVRNGISFRGVAEAVGEDGALLVRDGDVRYRLDSGEISVRLQGAGNLRQPTIT